MTPEINVKIWKSRMDSKKVRSTHCQITVKALSIADSFRATPTSHSPRCLPWLKANCMPQGLTGCCQAACQQRAETWCKQSTERFGFQLGTKSEPLHLQRWLTKTRENFRGLVSVTLLVAPITYSSRNTVHTENAWDGEKKASSRRLKLDVMRKNPRWDFN